MDGKEIDSSVRPRIRDDLTYERREVNGKARYLVKDPVRLHYFELSESQVAMMRLLDGDRSCAEVAQSLAMTYGALPPIETIVRFVTFLGDKLLLDLTFYRGRPAKIAGAIFKALRKEGITLRQRPSSGGRRAGSEEARIFEEGLAELRAGRAAESAACFSRLLERAPENRRARRIRELLHEQFFRAHRALPSHLRMVHLWNPDRFLARLDRRIGRWLFGPLGVAGFALTMLVGINVATQIQVPSLSSFGLGSLLVAQFFIGNVNLFLHELGHGLACKHYGGRVESMGVMLFWGVLPGAYCDVTEVHQFRSRPARVIVYLFGVAIELPLLCLWLLIYHFCADDFWMRPAILLSLVRELYIVAMNLVPFVVGYDGYYALSNYLDMPELAQRSYSYLGERLKLRLCGVPGSTRKVSPRERRILLAFGTFGGVYFVVWVFGLWFGFLFPLAIRYLHGLGLVLAVMYSINLFGKKTVRAVLSTATFLRQHGRQLVEPRRLFPIVGLSAALAGVLGIRWPLAVDGRMVVRPHVLAVLRAEEPGLVEEIPIHEGQRVVPGQVIARLSSRELDLSYATVAARLDQERLALQTLRRSPRPEQLALALARVEHARRQAEWRGRARARSRALLAVSVRSEADDVQVSRAAERSATAAEIAGAQLALTAAGPRPEENNAAAARVQASEAELGDLQRRRELLILRSPGAGIVITPKIEERRHLWLNRGAALGEIADLGQLEAELSLPLDEPLRSLTPGQPVALKADGDPDRTIRTWVARVPPAVSRARGEMVVETGVIPDVGWPIGFGGHARVYGPPRSLAYRWLVRPLLLIFDYALWPLWG